MGLLCALIGFMTGSLLNWASDYLPRFSGGANRSSDSTPRCAPALWQLVTSPTYREDLASFRKVAWSGIAVELLSASLFVYLWARFGPSAELALLALGISLFILVAATDLKHRLVPNALIYPAGGIALLLTLLPPGRHTLLALLGSGVGLAPFLLVALLKPGSIGGGDAKLGALIGLVLGFPQVLWGLSVGILAGGITAIVLLLVCRRDAKSHIAYAPFLCLGAVIALLWPFSFVALH
jgi:prepilin signal peptidase PulO-like enzyme (type II secretory pathway)